MMEVDGTIPRSRPRKIWRNLTVSMKIARVWACLKSLGINGEGKSKGQPANTFHLEKNNVQTVFV